MNYTKIQNDFKNLEKSTESLINKYNKSVDSIKSQELAIEKVKDKIANLQLLANEGFIKDIEVGQLQNLNKQLDIMTSKLSQTKEETKQTANKINEAFDEKKFNLGNIKNGIKDVNSNIEKFGKRLTSLVSTVAIFNLLRNSLTSLRNKFMTLLGTNDTFNSSLNQIKANLMTAFAPIYNACLPAINSLMNALSKVTGTIAVFVSGLFGKSLSDAKNQAKGLSKALDKTSKSGEKASGSLATFDKLEVINDGSGGGSGADSSSGNGINYDGEIQYSQKLLDFLNKIKDFITKNSDYILAFFAGISAGLLALKLGLTGIQSLGIGLLIAGIVLLIEGIIGYLNDPSWKNFGKVISGIGLAVAGVAVLFGAWPVAVAGAMIAILGLIISNWDKIKTSLQSGIDWLKTKGREIFVWLFGDIFVPLYDGFVNILQSVLNYFDNTFTDIKKIFDNIISFIKNVFTGNWKGAWENIKNIFFLILDLIKNHFVTVFNILGNLVLSVGKTVGNVIAGAFKAVVNAVLGAMESILNFPIKSINKLIKTINKVPGINLGTLSTFNLPRLATGTVIPPRQEFAAILGDQKHGTNIEAPLDTIKQADREVMQEFMNKLLSMRQEEKEVILKDWTFILQCGNIQFGKVVLQALRLLEKEMGKPLLLS